MANGGAAFAGVAVYAWHCNRDGNYSLYSSGIENRQRARRWGGAPGSAGRGAPPSGGMAPPDRLTVASPIAPAR